MSPAAVVWLIVGLLAVAAVLALYGAWRVRREDIAAQMTPDEEHAFYARPENQTTKGVPRRRTKRPL